PTWSATASPRPSRIHLAWVGATRFGRIVELDIAGVYTSDTRGWRADQVATSSLKNLGAPAMLPRRESPPAHALSLGRR
ncbi:MAG TPA: hypothetical protein VFH68_12930, partial [Polyangia bacterium]|nr:hypothetical protein [Polyangia bacterium]